MEKLGTKNIFYVMLNLITTRKCTLLHLLDEFHLNVNIFHTN